MSGADPLFFANAEVMQLQPADIFVPERIGFLHEDKAVALGRLMAVDGQRDLIKVAARKPTKTHPQPWALVTGRHRLRGAELEGNVIWALEVIGKPEDMVDLEASENLHRRPLGPIERAKFTAALVQAAQERIAREHGGLKQQQLAVKARWGRVKAGETTVENALKDDTEDTCANFAHVYGWEDSVGDALGMSRRTIHNDLSLYRLLIEPFSDLIEALSNHPVVGDNASQLKAIAQVRDEAKRRDVIALLLDDKDMSADIARIRLRIDHEKVAPPTKDVKFASTISDSWGRLSIAAKREYLPRFVTMLTGDMKDRLRQLLDEETPI
ncbi:ParB/RepB/Spo0J family partition protein [Allopontixanthobacter sp.]|uniref:ParB/RepB/Spo0J family partition protein n=1 Tax=Allopontixanthobacter sp. TaxID=2906452 RepID=UPI002AB96BFD|nr:ParB/RepB/Spo0J family partition protein [Allopontixanthobacter sp.]MDZ4308412.1 ParB/RepB/Spo0J family partition protein [Allopontixanthobacter sp.]